MKKLFCMLLCVVILLCCSIPAAAAAPASVDSTTAGILTIFARSAGNTRGIDLGHAFISFINVSDTDLTLGHVKVRPSTEVTIGTWNGSNGDQTGLWYNMESYLMYQAELNDEPDPFAGRVSLTTYLTMDQVNKLSNLLIYSNNWGLLANCTSFAVSAWNEVAPATILLLGVATPGALYDKIREYPQYKINKFIDAPIFVGYVDHLQRFKLWEGNGFRLAKGSMWRIETE